MLRVMPEQRHDDLADILARPAEELASLAGVDLSTARRWKAAKRVPVPVFRLLCITVLGDLGPVGWPRWKLIRGHLCSPEQWTFTAGEVLALPLLRAQRDAALAEIRLFKQLDAQPTTTEGEELDEILAALKKV